MANIIFQVSEDLQKMFDLALALTGEDKSVVFENLIRKYAHQVLSKTLDTVVINESETCFDKKSDSKNLNEKKYSSKDLIGSKAYRKIGLWAKRPHQLNHQVVKAFFLCEKNGIANYSKMEKCFISNTEHLIPESEMPYYKFLINFNSMTTDSGQSHGHIFDRIGQCVELAEYVKEYIVQFKNDFLV